MEKKVRRKRTWRQETPKDQLVVHLMAIEGTLSNMTDLIPQYADRLLREEFDKKVPQLIKYCQEAQKIIGLLPSGKWTK